MHIFPVIDLAFGLLIFLIALYSISAEDFALFKKRITINKVFDLAFITALVALLVSRLFYVIFNFSTAYLNPLVFFLFSYFPGLSLGGAIIGAASFLILYARKNKLPTERFIDFFGLSLLCAYPFEMLLSFLFTQKSILSLLFIFAIVFGIIFFFVNLSFFRKSTWKEGSIGILSTAYVVFLAFVTGFINKTEEIFFFLNKEDFLLIAIFIICCFLVIKQEKLLARRTLL